jgi:hypothetical protein
MDSQILHIISELKELIKVLEKSVKSENIPVIEIDILKSRLQQIYDEIIHLQMPQASGASTKESTVLKDEPKNNIVENHKNSKVVNNDLMQFDEQIQEEISEHKTEKGQAPDTKHIEEIQHHQESHQGKEILAEKYRKNQKYINELLAQGYHKQDISSLMQSKPLQDIEAAIGINEKFLFIRELFSNDEETFLKTIRILNNSSNFNEAFNYIHSTFNWNIEGEAAQKLLDLVRRRFIVEED